MARYKEIAKKEPLDKSKWGEPFGPRSYFLYNIFTKKRIGITCIPERAMFQVFINGVFVAEFAMRVRHGKPLIPGKNGIIPFVVDGYTSVKERKSKDQEHFAYKAKSVNNAFFIRKLIKRMTYDNLGPRLRWLLSVSGNQEVSRNIMAKVGVANFEKMTPLQVAWLGYRHLQGVDMSQGTDMLDRTVLSSDIKTGAGVSGIVTEFTKMGLTTIGQDQNNTLRKLFELEKKYHGILCKLISGYVNVGSDMLLSSREEIHWENLKWIGRETVEHMYKILEKSKFKTPDYMAKKTKAFKFKEMLSNFIQYLTDTHRMRGYDVAWFVEYTSKSFATQVENIVRVHDVASAIENARRALEREEMDRRYAEQDRLLGIQRAKLIDMPLWNKVLIPELEEFRIKIGRELVQAGEDCHNCIGGYITRTRTLFFRKDNICCSVTFARKFPLLGYRTGTAPKPEDGVLGFQIDQCYDARNNVTEASEAFQKLIEKAIQNRNAELRKDPPKIEEPEVKSNEAEEFAYAL